jgi:hypothetical protein
LPPLLACLALVTLVGMPATLFRCPRCNRRFFYTLLWRNPFTDRCLYCGLPNWAKQVPEQGS